MRRRRRLSRGVWFALSIGLVASAGHAEDPKPDPEMSYYATTLGRSNFEVVIVQYWSKGALFRSETVAAGHPIVTVVNGDWYYTWDAVTREGYKIERDEAIVAADATRIRPFGLDLQEMRAAGGEKISSEVVNGVAVDVYRLTDENGRRTLWVDAERLDLPIRIESYDRATGRAGTLDWLNWIPGLVLPDSFFEPTRGLDLERFKSYADYLERLGEKPVPPAPPLFHYLLFDRDAPTE